METRAWKKARFTYPAHVPTMISWEEKQYLHWLCSTCWQGNGDIVEIGPWLGGSTVCLAAGMREAGHPADRRLRVFDNFIWREFMSSRAALPLKPGESFQAFFEENVRDYAELIDTKARALPDEDVEDDQEWSSKHSTEREGVLPLSTSDVEDIEILFIDGAKSWRGIKSLFAVLSARMRPGETLIVCQDFKYWGTYWVPVFLSRLHDHFEAVHNVLSGTTVTFRLLSPLPPTLLEDLENHVAELPEERTLDDLDRASRLLGLSGDEAGAAHVQLGKVCFQAHGGRLAEAEQQLKLAQKTWPVFLSTNQLERARSYLQGRGVEVQNRLLLRVANRLPRFVRRLLQPQLTPK